MVSELYRNIMIATDGSENSQRAISYGIKLAKFSGATVYAVYVVNTPSTISDSWTAGKETMHEVMRDDGKNILSRVKKFGEDSKVPVKEILLEGHPSFEIINFAEKNNIDLIVMGTLGKTGIEKFLLGSVAEKVVRNSKVPVMVVHNGTPEDSGI